MQQPSEHGHVANENISLQEDNNSSLVQDTFIPLMVSDEKVIDNTGAGDNIPSKTDDTHLTEQEEDILYLQVYTGVYDDELKKMHREENQKNQIDNNTNNSNDISEYLSDSETEIRRAKWRYYEEPDKSIICYRCGGTGHISFDCIEQKKCNTCGNSGHTNRECPKNVKRCYNCDEIGHFARDCIQNTHQYNRDRYNRYNDKNYDRYDRYNNRKDDRYNSRRKIERRSSDSYYSKRNRYNDDDYDDYRNEYKRKRKRSPSLEKKHDKQLAVIDLTQDNSDNEHMQKRKEKKQKTYNSMNDDDDDDDKSNIQKPVHIKFNEDSTSSVIVVENITKDNHKTTTPIGEDNDFTLKNFKVAIGTNKIFCYNCGKEGHKGEECVKPVMEDEVTELYTRRPPRTREKSGEWVYAHGENPYIYIDEQRKKQKLEKRKNKEKKLKKRQETKQKKKYLTELRQSKNRAINLKDYSNDNGEYMGKRKRKRIQNYSSNFDNDSTTQKEKRKKKKKNKFSIKTKD